MTHIEQRYGTAAQWTSANPVLNKGEVGWETDTNKAKLGDGATSWTLLPYAVNTAPVTSVAGRTGAVTLTKADVGLANVDNTSDLSKPISTATQSALNLKAPLDSPILTGNPTAPTPATADNDTSIATTAFVKNQGYASTNNPTISNAVLTGNPTAPTPATADNDTSVATTAFVKSAINDVVSSYGYVNQSTNFNPPLSVFTDIPGLEITLTVPSLTAVYEITSHLDINKIVNTNNNNTLIGRLTINGSVQTGQINHISTGTGNRFMQGRVWIITNLTPGSTVFKMQAAATNVANEFTVGAPHSMLSVRRFL